MEGLCTYLEKYKRLMPPERHVAKLVARVVRDECGIALDEAAVTLRRGGAFLTCHPVERSEVLRSAPRILDLLQREHQIRLSFVR